jgi:uncharacterized protein YdeI (YjbR/CyaY-like superfamily)
MDGELSSAARPVEPRFFATSQDFRAWFEAHHTTERALLVGFHKTSSGIPSITWPGSVDQALCFGWIDGVRRRIDDTSYSIRFTPRKPTSIWSARNIARVGELTEMGLMHPAGLEAFARRTQERSAVYSSEQGDIELGRAYEKRLRANRAAWTFFQAQPASYRKAAIWWVISAKQETTRLRRLATLIDDSANSRTVKHLTRSTPGV